MMTKPTRHSHDYLRENLRAARKAARVPQTALARTLGVSQGTVSYWENGHRVPSAIQLIEAAHALGTTPEALITATPPHEGENGSTRDQEAAGAKEER
jgi:transcriptional regulator with XRE-family HTH domain